MKYLFVNTHYLPDTHYGGVVESGSKLFKYLKSFGYFNLSTVSENPEKAKPFLGTADRCYKSFIFHRFAFSFSAILGLWRDVCECDAVLINGIFTFPVTLAAFYAIILKKSFIVATRGGLEPWSVAHKKLKKYFYIKFVTLPLMRNAAYIHVTCSEEEKNIRALGFENTIKITNGIDAGEFQILPQKEDSGGKYTGKFVFLLLSRTDKEKGLDILIAAYRKFCAEFQRDKHKLLICGPDHQNYLKSMNLSYGVENIVSIPGVYGAEKIKMLRQADTLILPSYSENFGNVVAEALVCERPVITTTGTPWKEIEAVGCGLYINPDAGALFHAMKTMYLKSPEEREEMGRRGRKYILENFNWETKAKEIFKHLEEIGQQQIS